MSTEIESLESKINSTNFFINNVEKKTRNNFYNF